MAWHMPGLHRSDGRAHAKVVAQRSAAKGAGALCLPQHGSDEPGSRLLQYLGGGWVLLCRQDHAAGHVAHNSVIRELSLISHGAGLRAAYWTLEQAFAMTHPVASFDTDKPFAGRGGSSLRRKPRPKCELPEPGGAVY